MHFISLGHGTMLNLSRICYVDDFTGEDGEPLLAVFLAGLGKKDQPLVLDGAEWEALLGFLSGTDAVRPHALSTDEYVCDDCKREGEIDCN